MLNGTGHSLDQTTFGNARLNLNVTHCGPPVGPGPTGVRGEPPLFPETPQEGEEGGETPSTPRRAMGEGVHRLDVQRSSGCISSLPWVLLPPPPTEGVVGSGGTL